jgi:xylulokinase
MAEHCDSSRIPVFLPYLTGERSPHGDPHIRAGFFGLEDSTDRAALCRAVLEAVAFSFADAAESFGAVMATLPELTAIGGGSRSDFLLRLIATTTGRPIARAAGSDAGPAFGAARLAACGTGVLSLPDLGVQPAATDRFDPEPSEALDARLARYRALYQALRTLR